MTLLARIEAGASDRALAVLGVVDLAGDPDAPAGMTRLVLLGPAPQTFWPGFRNSPEAGDGLPDPVDRWSRRVIGRWACDLGGKALFPFGGPPHRPFLRWALASGRAFASPVGPLVHAEQGLMVSYRGALALRTPFPLPETGPSPCGTCVDQPCRTACPVGALGDAAYDVPRCKTHVRAPSGAACRSGCLVRRACPASLGAGRDPAQSAYHMTQFLGAR